MTRQEFEHVLRAAADIVEDELIVVGSQAVLGQFPNAPEPLLRSLELDVFPRHYPERADWIDGAIGDGSPFHQTYDYYAHSVGPETAKAPAGWEDRLVPVRVPALSSRGGTVTAWCLEVHDLVLAKLAAGREHDVAFAEEAIRSRLVDPEQLERGVESMPPAHRESTRRQLAGALRRVRHDAA